MIGNIPYNGLEFKGFPDEPGFSSALLRYVPGSSGELIRSASRGLALLDLLGALPVSGGISVDEIAGILDASPDEVRAVYLANADYFSWEWDYTARGGSGDYLLSQTERGRSLLEAPDPVLLYPALTQEATSTEMLSRSKVSRGWHLGDRVSWAVAGAADTQNRKSCGHVVKVGAAAADSKKGRRVKHDWCYDTLCPVCWGAWATRNKDRIIDRITGGIELWYRQGVDLGPVKCAVVSPPQEPAIGALYSPKAFTKLRREYVRVMESAGVTAGNYEFHPWRLKPWAKRAYAKAREQGYTGSKWEWLREKDLLGPDGSALKFSPHFHLFYTGYLKDSKQFSKDTGGWIYKNLEDENGAVIKFEPVGGLLLQTDGLERKIRYVLSHVGVLWDREKKKRPCLNVFWMGLWSSQKMAKDETTLEKTAAITSDGEPIVEYAKWDEKHEGGEWKPVWAEAVPTEFPWYDYLQIILYRVSRAGGGGPGDPGGVRGVVKRFRVLDDPDAAGAGE